MAETWKRILLEGEVVTLGDSSQLATSAAPTDDEDIANKKYVDDNAGGGDVATDTIWDAFGDIVFGWSADSARRHPLGLAGIPIINLKPVVNATVNKLDVFAKSSGAAPSAVNRISMSIFDGTGVFTTGRVTSVASGTGQIIMADATNYWNKGSLAGEIKTAYLYAIQSSADGGVVWALGGYSGFTRVPASTTATDDDFMHLEASSTYTRVVTDYCVAVAKVRYEYNTADSPDHTLQATVLDAPQVIWNPRSDYGYQKNLATTETVAGGIAEASKVSLVVKQSGKYLISASVQAETAAAGTVYVFIKTGSATYGTAVYKANRNSNYLSAAIQGSASKEAICYLNVGDTIHLGARVVGGAGNEILYGDSNYVGATALKFTRID